MEKEAELNLDHLCREALIRGDLQRARGKGFQRVDVHAIHLGKSEVYTLYAPSAQVFPRNSIIKVDIRVNISLPSIESSFRSSVLRPKIAVRIVRWAV